MVALVDARGFQLIPDIAGARRQGLQLKQQQQAFEQQQQLAPIQLQQQQAALQQQQRGLQQQTTQDVAQRDQLTISALISGAQVLKGIREPQGKIAFLEQQREQFAKGNLPTETIDEALQFAQQGDFASLEAATDELIRFGRQQGQQPFQFGQGRKVERTITDPETGESRQVQGLLTEVRNPLTGQVETQFSPIEGRFVSAQGETAAEGEARRIREAGGKKKATLEQELKFKPKIQSAITLARSKAKEQGEVFTDLARMEATLPTIRETVNNLRELATIATSTLGGKLFDAAVKETGFGSTKGATARAKFIAIINNQVLPLLKQTFGAAFTVQEGQELKATMGDPDATPEEKMAQLDAFIEQKERDIRAKTRQLDSGQDTEAQGVTRRIRFDAQGNIIQ